ncbi:MAG TPA: hypothetical protein VHZ03_42560 [Trebonia sp.]|nr:hypothetical protein [Trebonia sp.]
MTREASDIDLEHRVAGHHEKEFLVSGGVVLVGRDRLRSGPSRQSLRTP